jgi:hypothetical protein
MSLGYVLRNMGCQDKARDRAKNVLELGRRALDSAAWDAREPSGRMNVESALARARVLLQNLDPLARRDPHRRPPLTIDVAYRDPSPVADGKIGADEYGRGYFFDFTDESNPGRLYSRSRSRIKSRDDLSLTLHGAYTGTDLFLAFRVWDQFVDNEISTDPVFNDMVEVFIDGDRIANDFFRAGGNREGFQLVADSRGIQWTMATDFFNIDWKVATSIVTDGYIVEFKIPLHLIDTRDGPERSPPTGGSIILMNAGITDNDDYVQFVQENHAFLWADEASLSPFFGGEDTWVVALRFVPQ